MSKAEAIKPTWSRDGIDLYLGDCLEVLPQLPSGSVDAVVTDPPFDLASCGRRLHAFRDPEKSKGRIGWAGMCPATDYGDTTWAYAPLTAEGWNALCAVSKQQITFGVNRLHFLGPAGSLLVWDKKGKNGWEDTFSDCEIAWCSIVQPDRCFRWTWMGAIRQGSRVERLHPTQKPVELMEWLIHFTQGSVCDPFAGSGSTIVAAINKGRMAVGVEKDPHYFWDICVPRVEKALAERKEQLQFTEAAG